MFKMHFPWSTDSKLERPEDVLDPSACDVDLADRVVPLALLLEDIHMMRGRGALTTAHTHDDIVLARDACARVAQRVRGTAGGAV